METEYKIQNTKYRIQNTEYKIMNTGEHIWTVLVLKYNLCQNICISKHGKALGKIVRGL